jgi:hypothetical protein
METLKAKIKELLALNDVEVIHDFSQRGTDNPLYWENIMKRQKTLMSEINELARKNCTILGREIKFQMADSYAVYVITKVNKKTVQVNWINWCDGWVDNRLGRQGTLDTNYAMQQVRREDALQQLFGKKN